MSGHGGNIYQLRKDTELLSRESTDALLDFSASINPLGPPENIRALVSKHLDDIIHYPDPDCSELKGVIARKYNVIEKNIICGNGTTELLYNYIKICDAKRVVIPIPSYIDYENAAVAAGKKVLLIHLLKNKNFSLCFDKLYETILPGDLVIIANPNNPTSKSVKRSELIALAEKHPDTQFLIDEAFLEFKEKNDSVAEACQNISTLHSLTKFYAIPGIRLGFGVFQGALACKMKAMSLPWSVNSLAQQMGCSFLKNHEYEKKVLQKVNQLTNELYNELKQISSIDAYPPDANFILIHVIQKRRGKRLDEYLLEKSIAIRNCGNFKGLDETYFRIAVKKEQENKRLLDGIRKYFGLNVSQNKKKPPSIMLQGTSSNAGKSVLAAALCRILTQDGYKTAPFKAQNMSNNSFVTHAGLEMGRAQVVQAQAAKQLPDVKMNPILLKPNSQTGSQIIAQGMAVGNMNVKEYGKYKKEVGWSIVQKNYDELSSENEVIVLEGAGSPGEINLKKQDIVNMRMAKYAESQVLLVGDIDRGGVYASFIGTMEVLNNWERDLISGFVVNRFRGDATLLDSAHTYVKEHCDKEVLGVIPFIDHLGIPEEDSVTFKNDKIDSLASDKEHIKIGVINFPHISNFTDFDPFMNEPDVELKVIDEPQQLDGVDIVVLPGSKSVCADLEYIRVHGFTEALQRVKKHQKEIVGVCGGYMMLGEKITDPYKIESSVNEMKGLGLLSIHTELAMNKQLFQKKGVHTESGYPISGYEIHHGETISKQDFIYKFNDGSVCGTAAIDGYVWGGYLHGIFDNDRFRRWFIDRGLMRKGFAAKNRVLAIYDIERAFDRLADVVRNSLDMDVIYKHIGL